MLNGITIDDVFYNVACSVTRTARIVSSNVSGMLLDQTYFNDAQATYLEYNVKLAIPIGSESEYAALYEVITNPVPQHEFVVPYNQTMQSIVGRVEIIQDAFVKTETRNGIDVNLWRNISFRIVSNVPYKTAATVNDNRRQRR